MNNNPFVSVIIPAFNEEKYILQTLTALVNQDYKNYEVIIVNNASTDHTSAIVEQFIENNSNIFSLYYEHKQGTNYAREKARLQAKGSIIAQLDADCVPDRKWISNGVALLQKNKNTVAVTGPYFYFDSTWLMRTATLLTQAITYPFINVTVQLAKRGGILIGGNAFINAAILEKAGGYNTNLTFYGDDVDVALRISAYGWVKYSNQLILKTSSRRYNALGFWKVNKKYQEYFWNLVFRRYNRLQQTMELNHPR